MKISIQDCKVIFLCPDHNAKQRQRRLHMEALMESMGIHDWEFFKTGTNRQPLCLSEANLKVLQKYEFLLKPILILEDDVGWNGQLEIEVPDDADAVWLGFSRWSGSHFENKHHEKARFCKVDSTSNHDLVRVVSTLTTHAVLQISPRFRKFSIESQHRMTRFQDLINGSMQHTDVYFSRFQRFFQIQAPRRPFFYQLAKFSKQDVQDCTNFIIDDSQMSQEFTM